MPICSGDIADLVMNYGYALPEAECLRPIDTVEILLSLILMQGFQDCVNIS